MIGRVSLFRGARSLLAYIVQVWNFHTSPKKDIKNEFIW